MLYAANGQSIAIFAVITAFSDFVEAAAVNIGALQLKIEGALLPLLAIYLSFFDALPLLQHRSKRSKETPMDIESYRHRRGYK